MAEPHLADRVVLLIEKCSVPRRANKLVAAALGYVRTRVEPVMYVAYTDSYGDTKKLLNYWAKNGDDIFYAHRPVQKAKASQDLLMGLPGVGEVTRNKIAGSSKFSSFLDFVNNIERAKPLLPTNTFQRIKALLVEKWK